MIILAIDPGNIKSAWVLYDSKKKRLLDFDYQDNYNARKKINELTSLHIGRADVVACEMIASYGMPVGATVFDTCVWIGRFIDLVEVNGVPIEKVYRKDVKMTLCHSMKAKDANIRQALLDRFPASGGGKTPQIGVKKQPGPLFGVSGDVWAALAVAVHFGENFQGVY